MAPPYHMMPVDDAVREVARLGVPLLHFGQTVLWDEPTKALLFHAMRRTGLRVPVVAGVHDTDYFSKLPPSAGVSGPYAILPANDGTTRDFWAAACECAALFGGEHRVPLRRLARYGVPIARLSRESPSGRTASVDSVTEAWGWRGIARIGETNVTAWDVRTGEVANAIRGLVSWALQTSLGLIADEPTRQGAERFVAAMLRLVEEALAAHRDESLTEAFKAILRRLIVLLAGERPAHLNVTATSAFMRFNRDAAGHPRFAPVDLFLAPETRPLACEAYDRAVLGSGTYSLDAFGPGALPFELVVPGRGRGTLFIGTNEVHVDLPGGRVTLGSARGLAGRHTLASLVERRLGRDCALVGKAVVLPLMFLSECVMVLAEGGSPYVATSTRRFVEGLAAAGIRPALYPVLRLRYRALDALRSVDCKFCLPDHLAAAFGRKHIQAGEFAELWQGVLREQEMLLARLARSGGPRVVLEAAAAQDADWASRLERYNCVLCRMRQHGQHLEAMSRDLRAIACKAREVRRQVLDLEAQSGRIRSERLRPLWQLLDAHPTKAEADVIAREIASAESERGLCQSRIAELRKEAAALREAWRAKRHALREEARHGVPAVIHEELHRLLDEAGHERLRLVRRASLTLGLRAADHRPTAWWFPLLSGGEGGGPWYAEVDRLCEAYFEQLVPNGGPEGGA